MSTVLDTSIGRDSDDDILDLDQVIAEGLDPADARKVLGPHSALARWEVRERFEQHQRERWDPP